MTRPELPHPLDTPPLPSDSDVARLKQHIETIRTIFGNAAARNTHLEDTASSRLDVIRLDMDVAQLELDVLSAVAGTLSEAQSLDDEAIKMLQKKGTPYIKNFVIGNPHKEIVPNPDSYRTLRLELGRRAGLIAEELIADQPQFESPHLLGFDNRIRLAHYLANQMSTSTYTTIANDLQRERDSRYPSDGPTPRLVLRRPYGVDAQAGFNAYREFYAYPFTVGLQDPVIGEPTQSPDKTL